MYICTEFGAKAAQEWTSGKQTVLEEPAYSQVVLVRHAERVEATRDSLSRKLTSSRDKRLEIEGKLAADPGNRSLRKDMREVKDDIAKTNNEIMDEVNMELTSNERTAHKEACFKHCKSSVSLKLNRERCISCY